MSVICSHANATDNTYKPVQTLYNIMLEFHNAIVCCKPLRSASARSRVEQYTSRTVGEYQSVTESDC